MARISLQEEVLTNNVMERQLERQLMRQRGAGSRQLIDAKPVFTFGAPVPPPTCLGRTPKATTSQKSTRKPRTATRSKPKISTCEPPAGSGAATAGLCLQKDTGAFAASSPSQPRLVISTIPAKRKRGRPPSKRTDETIPAVEAKAELEDNPGANRLPVRRRKGKSVPGSVSASKALMRSPLAEVLEGDELELGFSQDAVLPVIKRRGRPRKNPLVEQQSVCNNQDEVIARVDATEGIPNSSKNLTKPAESLMHGKAPEEKKTPSAGPEINNLTTSDPIQLPVERKRGRPRKAAMVALEASCSGFAPGSATNEETSAPGSKQSSPELDNAMPKQALRKSRKHGRSKAVTLVKKRGRPPKGVVPSFCSATPPHAATPATEDGLETSRDSLSLAVQHNQPDKARPKKRGRPRKIVQQIPEGSVRAAPRPSARGPAVEVSGDTLLPTTKGSRPPEANPKKRGRPRKELVRVLSDPTNPHATTTSQKASDERSDDTLFLAMHRNHNEVHRPAPKTKQNRLLPKLPEEGNTTTQDHRVEIASSANAPPQARIPLSDRTNTTPLPSHSDFRFHHEIQRKPSKVPEQHPVSKVKPGPTGTTVSDVSTVTEGVKKRKRMEPTDAVPKAKRRCMVRPPSSPQSSEADELALWYPPRRPAAIV